MQRNHVIGLVTWAVVMGAFITSYTIVVVPKWCQKNGTEVVPPSTQDPFITTPMTTSTTEHPEISGRTFSFHLESSEILVCSVDYEIPLIVQMLNPVYHQILAKPKDGIQFHARAQTTVTFRTKKNAVNCDHFWGSHVNHQCLDISYNVSGQITGRGLEHFECDMEIPLEKEELRKLSNEPIIFYGFVYLKVDASMSIGIRYMFNEIILFEQLQTTEGHLRLPYKPDGSNASIILSSGRNSNLITVRYGEALN